MSADVQMIETARGRFQIRRHGSPGNPLVLCLHGFPDIAATFDALGETLTAAGFHMVAPQMRGYSPSVLDVPRGRDLFNVLAADALAIADVVAPNAPFAVVGHDNGAFATYSLLRQAGSRATAAVTLTAAHPAAVFKNTGKLPRQMWRSRYAVLFQMPGLSDWWASRNDFAYIEQLWRRWAHPGWALPSAHLRTVKDALRASWPAPLAHYRVMPFSGDETPLSTPTLYLIGAQDGCVLPAAGAGQERYFDGPFRSEVIPDAGHFLHLERPDVVGPKVVDWLRTYARS